MAEQEMLTVEQCDRDCRSEILRYLLDTLRTPCSDGDMPDDRGVLLDEIIARHRIAATKAADERVRVLEEALAWFGDQTRMELNHYSPMYCDDDDQSIEWRVHEKNGSINDREWTLIGRGATPLAAILDARAALAEEPGNL